MFIVYLKILIKVNLSFLFKKLFHVMIVTYNQNYQDEQLNFEEQDQMSIEVYVHHLNSTLNHLNQKYWIEISQGSFFIIYFFYF